MNAYVHEEIDPRFISTNILKICNVIRDKHYKVQPLFKNTGRGGGLSSAGAPGTAHSLHRNIGIKAEGVRNTTQYSSILR